jgi:predicted aspartyl protease
MDLSKFLKKNKYYGIKLKKLRSNHFKLKGKINGVKGHFILDTGASNTCVALKLSEKFRLNTSISDTKAAGAGSTEIDTHIAEDVHIALGKWKIENVDMVLLDLSHVNMALEMHGMKPVDGIIGADILKKGKAIIDYPTQMLYLKKKPLGYKFIG